MAYFKFKFVKGSKPAKKQKLIQNYFKVNTKEEKGTRGREIEASQFESQTEAETVEEINEDRETVKVPV